MNHSFDKDIAAAFGLAEAIILNHMQFWIEKNEANGKNFYDGSYWTYNSTKAYAEIFPYLSQRQIQCALKHLRDEGILKTGNYNELAYDRTLWYAFTEKGKCIMQKCKMEYVKMSNGFDAQVKPIPDINTDIINTPFIIPPCDDSAPAKQQTRHKYGTYQNVLLSDADYEKLKSEFPTDYNEWIERVSEYVAMNGKKYKDFLAVIRNWARRDTPKAKPRYM